MLNVIEVVDFSKGIGKATFWISLQGSDGGGRVAVWAAVEKSTNLTLSERSDCGGSAYFRFCYSDLGGWSGDDFPDWLTVVDIQSLAAGDFQSARIESQLL